MVNIILKFIRLNINQGNSEDIITIIKSYKNSRTDTDPLFIQSSDSIVRYYYCRFESIDIRLHSENDSE